MIPSKHAGLVRSCIFVIAINIVWTVVDPYGEHSAILAMVQNPRILNIAVVNSGVNAEMQFEILNKLPLVYRNLSRKNTVESSLRNRKGLAPMWNGGSAATARRDEIIIRISCASFKPITSFSDALYADWSLARILKVPYVCCLDEWLRFISDLFKREVGRVTMGNRKRADPWPISSHRNFILFARTILWYLDKSGLLFGLTSK